MKRIMVVAALVSAAWSSPADASDQMGLPDPDPVPTTTIQEDGESPAYWRLPDNAAAGWFRLNLGAASRLALEDEITQTTFALSALIGAEVGTGRTSPVAVVTELGYSYVYESQHWFVLGVGPALRGLGGGDDEDEVFRPVGRFGVAVIPHGILGTYDGDVAYGVRTSLLARWMTIGFEVAHQYARIPVRERNVHEIHFGISMVYAGGDHL